MGLYICSRIRTSVPTESAWAKSESYPAEPQSDDHPLRAAYADSLAATASRETCEKCSAVPPAPRTVFSV